MKKIIPLIIVAILFSQRGGYDSSYGPPKIGSLTGVVIDQKTNQPVPYATITLFSMPQDEAIDGIMCNDEGYFKMLELIPGKYKIVIESIGYEENIINNFNLNREDGIKRDLGLIKLNPKAIDLDAINVIEERSIYEFETDKIVYNASDDIISSGGTAEDVLRKVPMVTVNLDGEVSLRGNPNVKILIDGRDNRFGSEIDNIPSSLIDQVEVITSPSAKYDPEGMAGIINIKLKKGQYNGLNGKIKLNGRYNNKANIDKMNGFTTFLNYKHAKFNLYSSLNLKNRFNIREGWNKKDINYFYTNPLNGSDTTESFYFDYAKKSTKPNKSLKFGGDYYISEKLTLNSEVSWSSNIKNSENNQNITKPTTYTKTSGDNKDNKNYDIGSVLGINRTFDNPDKELIFEISFDHSKDNKKEFANSTEIINIYDYDKCLEYYNDTIDEADAMEWCMTAADPLITGTTHINDTTDVSRTYNKMNIDFSYKLPFNEKNKIEFGYDGRIINSSENMNLQITDTLGYTLKANINSLFKRHIHGVYFEYESKINEKISIKPSLRVEYVIREIRYNKLDESMGYYDSGELILNDPRYFDEHDNPDLIFKLLMDDKLGTQNSRLDKPNPELAFYPDLHFTYNLTNKKSIQFGMSRRVDRPGSSGWAGGMQIRPFPRNLYSEGTAFVGNPFLKPAYTTIADISYKSPIPMGFMMLNSHYSYTKDPIAWDRITTYGTNKSATTFENGEKRNEYGTDFFLMIMGQTLGGGITMSKVSHSNGDPDLNETLNRANMFMGINFPEKYIKLFDFEFGFYWMKMSTGTGTMFGDNGTMWANIGLGKSFFNNQFKISLKLDNLLNAGGFQMNETYNIYPENNEETFENGRNWGSEQTRMLSSGRPRTLTLNFTYSFGEMEDDKYKRRGARDSDGGEMDMGGF